MGESAYTWELIVVDDASSDDSAEIAADHPEVRLVRFGRHQGAGAARRVGTDLARGRAVVWTDADLAYPNENIPELVAALDGKDQVVGARSSEQGRAKFLRVPAKWAIRQLASFLTRTRIPDLNSGFRVMRADVARQFTSQLPDGFSCVTTITMAFLMSGYRVEYVPIEYRPRAGRSKFHWWRDTRSYVLQVIRMVLSYDPLRALMPIVTVLGLIFTAKLGFDIVDKDVRPATNTLLLGYALVQVLAVALLADLVVRATRPTELLPPADVEVLPSGVSPDGAEATHSGY